MAVDLQDIRERKLACVAGWQEIRAEAATDMKFVAGDPWDDNDKKLRDKRPTIAPEEMGQYFNQVINQLWASPRGMKFSPRGNGADDKGAQFYEAKARETEYRSNAKVHYTTAASNAIQRSYGFVRVYTDYESPRSANQEIWIGGFPDPDVVEPDPESLMPDSSDAQFFFVNEWLTLDEMQRKQPGTKVSSLNAWQANLPQWITGNKVLRSEYWYQTTRPRKLLLLTPKALPPMPGSALGLAQSAPKPVVSFADEVPEEILVESDVKELRTVEYPSVKMCVTNGIEIFSQHDWPGRYIPIVSCYGKILFVPVGGMTKRVILSMTRFGRDPWKAMCYTASQQLEVISQIPKAPLIGAKGQFAGLERDYQEAAYMPKPYLEYIARTEDTGAQPLPPPSRIDYPAGEHLQALELVKEGFRRAVQSAMGSNFLPSEMQAINQKSGVAMDKIGQAYASGTFHFVNNYEDMIRRVGIIFEDLADKIYDYAGETGTMQADGSAQVVAINTDEGVSTQGDYQVTVSTGPSSDSERDAAVQFGAALLPQLALIAQIAGPQAAAQLLAQVIRLQAGGPLMDAMADTIAPPEFKGADGKPLPPEAQVLVRQLQALQAKLQQAEQAIQTKQIEQQGKLANTQMHEQAENLRAAMDREVKIAVAEIAAQAKQSLQDMALFYEERKRIGAQLHETAMGGAQAIHDARLAAAAAEGEASENAKDRTHDLVMAHVNAAVQPPAPTNAPPP